MEWTLRQSTRDEWYLGAQIVSSSRLVANGLDCFVHSGADKHFAQIRAGDWELVAEREFSNVHTAKFWCELFAQRYKELMEWLPNDT